jgi:hypothetical protein
MALCSVVPFDFLVVVLLEPSSIFEWCGVGDETDETIGMRYLLVP